MYQRHRPFFGITMGQTSSRHDIYQVTKFDEGDDFLRQLVHMDTSGCETSRPYNNAGVGSALRPLAYENNRDNKAVNYRQRNEKVMSKLCF